MSAPTAIGINLLWLVPGVVGGSEEYATRQLEALALHAPSDLHFVVCALAPFRHAYPDLSSAFETVTVPLEGSVKALRVGVENTWLARQARRRHFALVHHFGGRMPSVSPVPGIVTVHDLQPLEDPKNFTMVKRTFLRRALPRSVGRAAAVVTPSEYVRRDVIDTFGVPPERTVAIAAPVHVRAAPAPRPHVLPPTVAALVDTRTPFFLYPAITYRHKNHVTLLDAFAALRDEHPRVRLVLTGGTGDAEEAVRSRIAELGLGDAVLRTGRVPRPVLDLLIDTATAVVFPSRFEGFGLPVLEAMAAGCAVIAADATALPEVVRDAGVLVAPDDPTAWTAAMAALLVSSGVGRAAAGRQRALAYSHDRIAGQLVALYRAALAGRPVSEGA